MVAEHAHPPLDRALGHAFARARRARREARLGKSLVNRRDRRQKRRGASEQVVRRCARRLVALEHTATSVDERAAELPHYLHEHRLLLVGRKRAGPRGAGSALTAEKLPPRVQHAEQLRRDESSELAHVCGAHRLSPRRAHSHLFARLCPALRRLGLFLLAICLLTVSCQRKLGDGARKRRAAPGEVLLEQRLLVAAQLEQQPRVHPHLVGCKCFVLEPRGERARELAHDSITFSADRLEGGDRAEAHHQACGAHMAAHSHGVLARVDAALQPRRQLEQELQLV
mmetsp:Transcript_13417/g.40668  ORF Transcript_13417/g.40668 Transcript_13417/m.40668 type:complete len:284 (+) Transcript_13417:1572-2423(+)